MIDIASLEQVLEQGHADTDLVGVPISMIRAVTKELRSCRAAAAQAAANATIGTVCAEMAA